MQIQCILAREILDSRGNPTVEVEVTVSHTGQTFVGREQVPSGASTGIHETLELRDHDSRYLGKGVLKAVKNINTIIASHLQGFDPREQQKIDTLLRRLDGTKNKSRLGANALVGASLACARAAALAERIPLYEHLARLANTGKPRIIPVPFLNVINGGKHAVTPLAFQEYMIVPFGKTFAESLRMGTEVYHHLQKILAESQEGAALNVGDEGGCVPQLSHVEEPLQFLMRAVKKAGYTSKIKFALDVAASQFYNNGKYYVDRKYMMPEQLMRLYDSLLRKYPLISIEDPFDQEDFAHTAALTKQHKKICVVGDDLLVTNPALIKRAITQKACNTLLLKVNQIGTLSEAFDAAHVARDAGWKVMVSHRSGETESTFIADLAVALGCGMIKSGAPCRGERIAKYNQLLRIEEELGTRARYVGEDILKR